LDERNDQRSATALLRMCSKNGNACFQIAQSPLGTMEAEIPSITPMHAQFKPFASIQGRRL
jgi:hypothetical protein